MWTLQAANQHILHHMQGKSLYTICAFNYSLRNSTHVTEMGISTSISLFLASSDNYTVGYRDNDLNVVISLQRYTFLLKSDIDHLRDDAKQLDI